MFWYFDYEEPVFRPPSEARSLIFQVTVGCSQNHCSFCGMYKTKRFRVRAPADLRREIDAVPRDHRPWVKRVFLADGDALAAPQEVLLEVLDDLDRGFPELTRVGAYASPASLAGKTVGQLQALRERKLRILYFGLESGDDATLELSGKGFRAEEMLRLCRRAREAGIKLSVTAILGLAGAARSREHARATAAWINALSPEYFSLLTLFRRRNEAHFERIDPLTNGQVLEEALEIVRLLAPERTILRSNHVSNVLNLEGSYPKDRERIIAQAEAALAKARRRPDWFRQVPDYREEVF